MVDSACPRTRFTALHVACQRGHVELAELLCGVGADRRARNLRGKTPRDLARVKKHAAVLEMLDA